MRMVLSRLNLEKEALSIQCFSGVSEVHRHESSLASPEIAVELRELVQDVLR